LKLLSISTSPPIRLVGKFFSRELLQNPSFAIICWYWVGEHLEEHDTHAEKSVFSDISRNLPSWDLKKWESKGNHLKNAMFAKK